MRLEQEANMYSKDDKYSSAADFLLKYLAFGPRDYMEVKTRARAHGYGQKELKDARHELKVRTYNIGGGVYYWGLPWSGFPSKREGGKESYEKME